MGSFVDWYRRCFRAPAAQRTAKRKGAPYRRPLLLEALEARWVPSTYSIAANFTSTAVAPGDTLWFSSVASGVNGLGSSLASITVTNQTISFTDSFAGTINVSLPNAVLTFTPGGTSATTTFNSSNQWVTNVPSNLGGNLFLSGYALPLPSGLHGGDTVTWSATFTSSVSGLQFQWAWAAAAYTSFNTGYGSLGVKPCDDGNASIYKNGDHAGTPESYKTHVTSGATGNGGGNYTGNNSSNTQVTPTYTPIYVTLAGTVYNDANGNGVFDTGDTGIGGVTLNLTGTTNGGASVTATTTTASGGTYSFTTDSNGNPLVAGTYQITEIEPTGYYEGGDTVGTVNGTADGTLVPGNVIGSITLAVGQSGIGYNFGEVNPFTQVTPAYPYSSSNPLTDVAFNESEIMYGASVNLATSTFDIFYSDEHAMCLGINQVSVTNTSGTTTTNYSIAPLSTNPGSAVNPAVGDTTVTGTQAAVDPSTRPLFPSLYLTDITTNPSSTSGDWQNGGTAITPSAVYGTWKPFSIAVNNTTSPATVTETGASDPTPANGWNLGAGADPVPASIAGSNAGYGTEVQWSLSSLYSQGVLIPGHNYRFYFIVHDGDQNKTGGDVGQAAFDFTYRGPVTVAGTVYNDQNATGSYASGDSGIGGVNVTLTGTTATGQSVTATTTTAANGTYKFTTDGNGNLLQRGTYQVTESTPSGYLLDSSTVGTVNGTSDGAVVSPTVLSSIALSDGQNGINYNFGNVLPVTISGTVYYDANANGAPDQNEPGIANVTLTLTGTNYLGQSITATTTTSVTGTYSFSTDSNGNVLGPGTYQINETQPTGYLTGTDSVGTLIGGSGATSINWGQGFQTSVNNVYTGPSGTNLGFAHDLVNSSNDNIFGGGQSKDTSSITQWGWVYQKPQNKDDLADAFAVAYTDAGTGHRYLLTGVDRYSSNGDTTIGVWYFQNQVSVNPNGTFSGIHSDGDILLVADFGGSGGSSVGVYRWTGTDASGSLVAYTPPAGAAYLSVNTGPVSVPWPYVDASGFTSPQAGEFMEMGIDFSALFGSNLPRYSAFMAETRSSNSPSSTLSDFVLGNVNAIVASGGTTSGKLTPPNILGSIVISSNQNGINYNFGEVLPVTLAGTVYEDKNDNGVLDSGEPGIPGVTLTLSGTNIQGTAITATTTTAANGTYSFTTDSNGNLLLPGTYAITETPPSGYLAGSNTVGTVNGTADGTLLTGNKIGSIVLVSNQNGISYNFGNLKPVTIGGLVYEDKNDSGVFASGDTGIAGVTLTLSGTNDQGTSITATTTTIANGTYSFTIDNNGNSLRPGTYQIVETVPGGYLARAAAAGTVNGTADGTLVSITQIGSIVMAESQSGINYYFGDIKPVAIGGTVYEDKNDNGVLNSGEPGISGVTLTLSGTNDQGTSITATTTTAANGTYSFTTDTSGNVIRPGTYQIVETQPSGYLLGASTVGTVNGTSDGVVISATKIGSVVLAESQTGVSYNFGDIKPVTVGGTVYEDTNDNGVLNTGEPGISGVTLTLNGTNDQGTSITATVTTNSGGVYSFTTDSSGNALRPGTYTITETQPSGYLTRASTVGTINGTADGTAVSPTQIGSVVLAESQAGINYNFGNLKPVAVGGTVYEDSNDNGVLNTGEPGISGVTLTLTGTNDQGTSISVTATTNASGVYSFTTDSSGNQLRPGTYTITETLPSGYLTRAATVGTVNGTTDGAVVSATQVGSVVLAESQVGVNYNFGNLKPVTVGGTVYEDTNDNGVLNSGEPGISGVTLTLSGTNDKGTSISATTTTGSGGSYSFTTDSNGNALRPGTYTITETLPGGYLTRAATVGTVNGTNDGTVVSATKINSIVLAESQLGVNYNFGNVKPVTVGGMVYEDKNDSGAFVSGDPGIAGVTLTLSGTNDQGTSITATATTNASGVYSFTTDSSGNALRPGTYAITETQPVGYLVRAAAVGTVNGTSDGSVVSASKIGSIVMPESQSGINYNFGDIRPGAVAGTVYEDTNDNGVLDNGEPRISGVRLTFTGTNDQGTSITATATTNASGAYNFTADSNGNVIRPGTYQVAETLPGGYLTRAATVGTVNGTADGTMVSATAIGSIVLAESQSGINYNFGNVKPVTVGGTVYEDTNNNGVLNSGEPGISGVTLTLSGTNDQGTSITATATTNAGGAYSFTTDSNGNVLRPGTYAITETVPGGYLTGAATVGTVSGTTDGTMVSATKIGSIMMGESQSGVSYNFGNLKPVNIGGMVYEDTNDSGAFVSGDPGISGVTLTLSGTNDQGTSITATATTNSSGAYSFTTDSTGNTLRPGTYQIVETVPSGWLARAATVGTVNGTADGTVVSATNIGSIVLAESQSGVSYVFGDIRPVKLAGTVYEDDKGLGVYASGDVGIAGVTLTLTGTNDQGTSITATATTNTSGVYSFTTDSSGNVIRPGTYTITETPPGGYLLGNDTVGTVNGSTDGTATSLTRISSIVMAESQSGINYNFGNVKPVTIAGIVYEDVNGTGVYGSGDNLMSGVTVTLTGTNVQGISVTATATTNASGAYSFATDSNNNVLLPGTYQVTETPPSGYLLGKDAVGTVNGTTDGSLVSFTQIGSIVLGSGANGINYDFANVKPVTISGLVYNDLGDMGAYQAGDPGIPGVTLTLTGTNNLGQSVTATTTTASDGTYSFSTDNSGNKLPPGTYTITETQPNGYLPAQATVGTVNGVADGTEASRTQFSAINLPEGQAGIHYNFGQVIPVGVSGYVYVDSNHDTVKDNGETGDGQAEQIMLTGTDMYGNSVTLYTTTDPVTGYYSFTNLVPGTYTVTYVSTSYPYLFEYANVGTVNGVTVGQNPASNILSQFTLTSGVAGINYDFAEILAGS